MQISLIWIYTVILLYMHTSNLWITSIHLRHFIFVNGRQLPTYLPISYRHPVCCHVVQFLKETSVRLPQQFCLTMFHMEIIFIFLHISNSFHTAIVGYSVSPLANSTEFIMLLASSPHLACICIYQKRMLLFYRILLMTLLPANIKLSSAKRCQKQHRGPVMLSCWQMPVLWIRI